MGQRRVVVAHALVRVADTLVPLGVLRRPVGELCDLPEERGHDEPAHPDENDERDEVDEYGRQRARQAEVTVEPFARPAESRREEHAHEHDEQRVPQQHEQHERDDRQNREEEAEIDR